MAEQQVVFRCRTCDDRNRAELGLPGFEPLQTQFESLTDVWVHIQDTINLETATPHTVIALITDDVPATFLVG